MTGRYCFHRCLSVNISGGGGVPGLTFSGGGGGTRSMATRRAVCLLRSRRTFLLILLFPTIMFGNISVTDGLEVMSCA